MKMKTFVAVTLATLSLSSRAEQCLYLSDSFRNTPGQRVGHIEITLRNGVFVSAAALPADWQVSIENGAGPTAKFEAQAIHGASALDPQSFDGIFTVKAVLEDVGIEAELVVVPQVDGDVGKSVRGTMRVRDGRCRSKLR